MPLFSFSLDSFQITDTRSVHTDTNFGVMTVKVGAGTPQTVFSPAYGNLNNGTYQGNMSCAGLTITPGQSVTVNYMIINAGFSTKANIDAVLKAVSVESASIPRPELRFMSCLGAFATQYASQLNTILRPGCDGLVAAEQDTFTYDELIGFTARSPYFMQATTHTGVTLKACNPRPSNYIAHWSMAEVVNVPNVVGEQVGTAAKRGSAAYDLNGTVPWQIQRGCPLSTSAYVKGQSIFGLVPLNHPLTLVTSLIAP